jgi:dephospho-CoA kinase
VTIFVGLTGGIASGKSTVARLLESRGAIVVDADRVAHDLLAPGTPVHQAVVERFGPGILSPDGTIDRRALAATVFAPAASPTAAQSAPPNPADSREDQAARTDAASSAGGQVLTGSGSSGGPAAGTGTGSSGSQARIDLEAIIHPAVWREVAERVAEARDAERADGRLRVVVVDAPLIVESLPDRGASIGLQALIVVSARVEDQIERSLGLGRSADDVRARMAAQAPPAQKLAAADYVVDNRGTLEDLERSVDVLWTDLIARFGPDPSTR